MSRYLAYRNFMIDTYRLNPQEYLTSTACVWQTDRQTPPMAQSCSSTAEHCKDWKCHQFICKNNKLL